MPSPLISLKHARRIYLGPRITWVSLQDGSWLRLPGYEKAVPVSNDEQAKITAYDDDTYGVFTPAYAGGQRITGSSL